MDDFRSRSYSDGGSMEMEVYGSRAAPPSSSGMQGLRCYSTPYDSSHQQQQQQQQEPKELKLKKGKSASSSTSSSSSIWCLSDPELQRKRRVAGYKAYTVEGKMKGSLRKSFRWIKERCSQVVGGRW